MIAKINIFRAIFSVAIILIAMLPLNLYAESISLDFGNGGSLSGQILRMVLLLTVLSLAPSILMMVTSFTRIIVVLSLLRSAMGIQQTPPNSVLISLALFLTFFVMSPVFTESYNNGIAPLIAEKIDEKEAFKQTTAPFHKFMMGQVLEDDVALFMNLAKIDMVDRAEDVPFRVLVPAFMISELKRAFEIGFLVFLPFLIIDMIVASTLMSMGMMMLPPVMIALPFKIIFFVVIDGWHMISENLVRSFGI